MNNLHTVALFTCYWAQLWYIEATAARSRRFHRWRTIEWCSRCGSGIVWRWLAGYPISIHCLRGTTFEVLEEIIDLNFNRTWCVCHCVSHVNCHTSHMCFPFKFSQIFLTKQFIPFCSLFALFSRKISFVVITFFIHYSTLEAVSVHFVALPVRFRNWYCVTLQLQHSQFRQTIWPLHFSPSSAILTIKMTN